MKYEHENFLPKANILTINNSINLHKPGQNK